MGDIVHHLERFIGVYFNFVVVILAAVFNVVTIRVLLHMNLAKTLKTILLTLMAVETILSVISLPVPLMNGGHLEWLLDTIWQVHTIFSL